MSSYECVCLIKCSRIYYPSNFIINQNISYFNYIKVLKYVVIELDLEQLETVTKPYWLILVKEKSIDDYILKK